MARVVRIAHATSIDVGTLFAMAEKFSVFTRPGKPESRLLFHGCSPFGRLVDVWISTCGSRTAVGVLSLACPRESTQREDTPNGANGSCAPLPLGPSPNHSTSLCC